MRLVTMVSVVMMSFVACSSGSAVSPDQGPGPADGRRSDLGSADGAAAVDLASPADRRQALDQSGADGSAQSDLTPVADKMAQSPDSLKKGSMIMRDLEDILLSGTPGLTAPGFRCKAYTICGLSQTGIYSTPNLGHYQSDDSYLDGVSLSPPEAIKFTVHIGAASQCGNPAVTIAAGEWVALVYDGGQRMRFYLPAFSGTDLTLYVAADGSTYYDSMLTKLAQKRP